MSGIGKRRVKVAVQADSVEWVLVKFIEDDILSTPIRIDKVIDENSGLYGMEKNLESGDICLAPYSDGHLYKAKILLRTADKEKALKDRKILMAANPEHEKKGNKNGQKKGEKKSSKRTKTEECKDQENKKTKKEILEEKKLRENSRTETLLHAQDYILKHVRNFNINPPNNQDTTPTLQPPISCPPTANIAVPSTSKPGATSNPSIALSTPNSSAPNASHPSNMSYPQVDQISSSSQSTTQLPTNSYPSTANTAQSNIAPPSTNPTITSVVPPSTYPPATDNSSSAQTPTSYSHAASTAHSFIDQPVGNIVKPHSITQSTSSISCAFTASYSSTPNAAQSHPSISYPPSFTATQPQPLYYPSAHSSPTHQSQFSTPPLSSDTTTNTSDVLRRSLITLNDCYDCSLKDAQIESLQQALNQCTRDNQDLLFRVQELEKERRKSDSTQGEEESVVRDHYTPKRGIIVDWSDYLLVGVGKDAPPNYERLVEECEVVVPRKWLTEVLGKCKGKGRSFTIKKFIDGFFEPEDLVKKTAITFVPKNKVAQSLKVYAIKTLGMRDAEFNMAFNSKAQTAKRALNFGGEKSLRVHQHVKFFTVEHIVCYRTLPRFFLFELI